MNRYINYTLTHIIASLAYKAYKNANMCTKYTKTVQSKRYTKIQIL